LVDPKSGKPRFAEWFSAHVNLYSEETEVNPKESLVSRARYEPAISGGKCTHFCRELSVGVTFLNATRVNPGPLIAFFEGFLTEFLHLDITRGILPSAFSKLGRLFRQLPTGETEWHIWGCKSQRIL
jgi:hypothetical protein